MIALHVAFFSARYVPILEIERENRLHGCSEIVAFMKVDKTYVLQYRRSLSISVDCQYSNHLLILVSLELMCSIKGCTVKICNPSCVKADPTLSTEIFLCIRLLNEFIKKLRTTYPRSYINIVSLRIVKAREQFCKKAHTPFKTYMLIQIHLLIKRKS